MYKPKGFREDGQYPVITYVYGGPESQTVRDEWRTNVWHYLMLEKGYVVVCVDNRGTDGRGEAFRKATYMQLGKLELEDQTRAAKYLGSLPWIDASRIGIWGGSYGGYMSALCLTRAPDVFRLGIVLYPVTNWRYYDTIYTERFMRTPQENPDGYDENSPVHYADSLRGKLLLVHGMSDDNVHLQNSVDFADALIRAGRKFDMLFYPNQIHGIRQQAAVHLRDKMTRFVEENL
jgi:dipeptidyl-peptidase-4